MTRRLHLVFGGEVATPRQNHLKAVRQNHIIGTYPDYATAFSACKAGAQRWADNAHLRYSIAHLHRLREDGQISADAEAMQA